MLERGAELALIVARVDARIDAWRDWARRPRPRRRRSCARRGEPAAAGPAGSCPAPSRRSRDRRRPWRPSRSAAAVSPPWCWSRPACRCGLTSRSVGGRTGWAGAAAWPACCPPDSSDRTSAHCRAAALSSGLRGACLVGRVVCVEPRRRRPAPARGAHRECARQREHDPAQGRLRDPHSENSPDHAVPVILSARSPIRRQPVKHWLRSVTWNLGEGMECCGARIDLLPHSAAARGDRLVDLSRRRHRAGRARARGPARSCTAR